MKTEAELLQALEVRQRVFVQEQQIPVALELDGTDGTATHSAAFCQGKIIGTGRFVPQGNGFARIGRMAVDKEFRRQGVGGRILRCLEVEARANGSCWVVLHAMRYQCELPLFEG